MTESLYRIDGPVAVIELNAPPVNSLGFALRRHLADALEAALGDARVLAVVVYGGEDAFSGGADLREFDSPEANRRPNLPDLVELLERAGKPVVAAVGRLCLGGGLELALGCHYRVVHARARMGLPEIELGLMPGAGGTQRLPRAIGVEAALNLILSGKPVAMAGYAETPLVDAVAEDGSLLATAVSLARRVLDQQGPWPRLRALTVAGEGNDLFLQFARGMVAARRDRGEAPLRCIEAVEAALGDFDAGLAREYNSFWSLMASPVSAALRHAFLAERGCARIPGLPADLAEREIRAVGIVGAGTMGAGIALCFLDAGFPVTLLDTTEAALARGREHINKTWAGLVARGRLEETQRAERAARLSTTLDYAALADADLIIEAVFEDMAAKTAVFARLDAVARPGAILASNTSTLDLNALAAGTGRPADVVGLHFFSPANIMKLLEVVRGSATAPQVVHTAMRLAKRIGKVAVLSGVCDGFIGNRMLNEYLRVAGLLLDAGATPWAIDRALEAWGMAMGPFRMMDMAGNDIGWAIRKRLMAERPAMRFSPIPDRLCELGRFGQKTGLGWYRYPPGARQGEPDPEVEALIDAQRAALGITPRRIGAEEIVERCLYALVNEGARILAEGIALRAADIDTVYLAGYGFPRWRGGPMHYAEQRGLRQVLRRMAEFAAEPGGDAAFWTPAPLLRELAAGGRDFASLGVAA